MADFLAAIPYTLNYEGGYATYDGDTYAGITRKNFPNWEGWAILDNYMPLKSRQLVDNIDLKAKINMFYKANFWDKIKGDYIDNQAVATYFHDWYVNAGNKAIVEVQHVIGCDPADGIFGSGSLAKLNEAGDCLTDIHNARVLYYNRVGVNGSAKFLQGWLNRANDLYGKLS
jgi:lysozyme family protein